MKAYLKLFSVVFFALMLLFTISGIVLSNTSEHRKAKNNPLVCKTSCKKNNLNVTAKSYKLTAQTKLILLYNSATGYCFGFYTLADDQDRNDQACASSSCNTNVVSYLTALINSI